MKVGAHYSNDRRCEFIVWAPFLKEVSVHMVSPSERLVPLIPQSDGYWKATIDGISAGTRYFYKLNENCKRPDPASNYQPHGVHGPSEIIDHASFQWNDDIWRGIAPSEMIIYELHTGTFSPEGTFDSIIPRLPALRELGINAIELMPVAQFPGGRNWGYDGVYPFAVQNSYGGPNGLKRLVNACHRQGIAVILDTVYNHIGPEGNYLSDFGPYFTEKYKTPWGRAVNFDDPYCDGLRNFFLENASYWFQLYHIDALRLDAIHAIFDMSAKPFLQELAERTEELSRKIGRNFYLIPESDLNDDRISRRPELGGYGMDAQWCDDFHHAVHTLLTGEDQGYYMDFGHVQDLVKAIKEGFVYSGQFSAFRKRRHGVSSKNVPADRFVVFSQNHDQIGNRLQGERLSKLVPYETLKLAAGIVLLSPFIPLIFMGEEYGEEAPFLYFISHGDQDLIEAVRRGRKEEFREFQWQGEPPDPQSEETFLRARISWEHREKGRHRILREIYRTLIRLRKEIPALSCLDKDRLEVRGTEENRVLYLKRWSDRCQAHCFFNFNRSDVPFSFEKPDTGWNKIFDSAEPIWNGPGTLLPDILRGHSFAVYLTQE
jgi:maltooligosyltrehalose trehalohydrolase